jgi:hypothetical protein
MSQKSFPKGLDGRMRDENGRIRQKRLDTQVETLRKEYDEATQPKSRRRRAPAPTTTIRFSLRFTGAEPR